MLDTYQQGRQHNKKHTEKGATNIEHALFWGFWSVFISTIRLCTATDFYDEWLVDINVSPERLVGHFRPWCSTRKSSFLYTRPRTKQILVSCKRTACTTNISLSRLTMDGLWFDSLALTKMCNTASFSRNGYKICVYMYTWKFVVCARNMQTRRGSCTAEVLIFPLWLAI